MNKTGALIVAAGMSTRLRTFKQLKKIDGLSMAERVVRHFKNAGIDEIVMVTGCRAEEVEEEVSSYDITFIRNENYAVTQMFDSVKMGLTYFKNRVDRLFFCPVDVPFVSERTMKRLIEAEGRWVYPICKARIGHPIRIDADLIPQILAYEGNRGLKGALDELGFSPVRLLVNDETAVTDIDTPADFEHVAMIRREKMKKRTAAIFGAGQAGIMAAKWLPTDQNLLCFIDNNKTKQMDILLGVPVCSLTEALGAEPDIIWIAVLNREAAESIRLQISTAGFMGEIVELKHYRQEQDIRLAALRLIAEEINRRKVPGEAAELGVFRGDFAAEINRLFPQKQLYLFDTFSGFDARDLTIEKQKGSHQADRWDFSDTGVELVREKLPYPNQAVFCPGYFPESIEENQLSLPEFAFVNLDPDLYEPILRGLEIFWPLLSPGGVILIHDYNSMQFLGAKKAVDEFCRARNLFVLPLPDLHGSAMLIKQGQLI